MDWKNSLAQVVHAYNCTRNEATGFAPYFLLFGRHPRLPIDIMFNLSPRDQFSSHQEYAESWRKRMDQAYKLTSESASMASGRAKDRYDRKTHGAEIQPGCRVLVRNMSERGGPGKIRSYWEEQVYVVHKKRSEYPVYEVHPETGQGRVRVLHRNMLCLVNSCQLNEPQQL